MVVVVLVHCAGNNNTEQWQCAHVIVFVPSNIEAQKDHSERERDSEYESMRDGCGGSNAKE